MDYTPSQVSVGTGGKQIPVQRADGHHETPGEGGRIPRPIGSAYPDIG